MILSVLAGCPVSDQTATPTATAGPEGDLGESTLDTPEASTTETPAPTAPAVRTTPVVPTATPSVAPAVPAAPTQGTTLR